MKRFLLALVLCCGSACAAPPKEEIKVLVVANFENGADFGDAPGEYQNWVERLHLTEERPIQGVPDRLRRNKDGVYGLLMRHGSLDLHALALDSHYDIRHAYWIFTGISGVDPNVASVGSVAWARWVVDGDALREIDDRTVPKGWPYGLYAIGADRPDALPADANHYGSVTDVAELGMAYPLNRKLADWAYGLTRGVRLADDKAIAERRKGWVGFPKAQQPPVVMMGETLGAFRYWHGASRNEWAERWVTLWTRGAGQFVMTNEESQVYQKDMRVLAGLGLVDLNRVMVLRSASNFDMPPPGMAITDSIGDEGPGQALAFDNNERAGEPVVRELVKHWAVYRERVPG